MTETKPQIEQQMAPADTVIASAIRAAASSPCRRKDGAVIFRGQYEISCGHHQKPQGVPCDGAVACSAACQKEAVHAAQTALLGVGALDVFGADLLHVQTVDGALVPSGAPSCVECSKLIVGAGIAGVWWYHADGWRWYPADEFHRVSLTQ